MKTSRSGTYCSPSVALLTATVLALFADITLADEQRFTVRHLAGACTVETENSIERAHCVGFIAGVLDAYQSLRQFGSLDGPMCLPEDGMSPGAAIVVFGTWFEAHRELAELSAATGVLLAMRQRFPCD